MISFLTRVKHFIIHYYVNPSVPNAHKKCKNYKNFDAKIRRDYQKNSYDRRNYESVDEKSLSKVMSRKTTKKEFRQ